MVSKKPKHTTNEKTKFTKGNRLSWDNITQPEPTGYQVRVVRKRKEYSRFFSFRRWGGKKKAFEAANHWRDQVKVVKKGNQKRWVYASSTNQSTGVLGVCRTICHDTRKDLYYLVFSVGWIDHTGKKRTKSFRVGNAETYDFKQEIKAFEAAKQFRLDWERHADEDTLSSFDVADYLNWREW